MGTFIATFTGAWGGGAWAGTGAGGTGAGGTSAPPGAARRSPACPSVCTIRSRWPSNCVVPLFRTRFARCTSAPLPRYALWIFSNKYRQWSSVPCHPAMARTQMWKSVAARDSQSSTSSGATSTQDPRYRRIRFTMPDNMAGVMSMPHQSRPNFSRKYG